MHTQHLTVNRWSAMFTFSGKERDRETGYSYFGARFYNAEYSCWLSVDPLHHKRPWESPFLYCGGSPLNRVDPNGMIWDDSQLTESQKAEWKKNVQNASNESPLFKAMYDQLDKSETVYKVNIGATKGNTQGQFNTADNTITFNSEQSMVSADAYTEEMFHAYQKDNAGLYESGKSFNMEFEAKVAKHFMMYELGVGMSSGASQNMGILDKIDNASNYGEKMPTYQLLRNSVIQNIYQNEANKYGAENKRINYGNSHYQAPTQQNPASLYKLFKDVRY